MQGFGDASTNAKRTDFPARLTMAVAGLASPHENVAVGPASVSTAFCMLAMGWGAYTPQRQAILDAIGVEEPTKFNNLTPEVEGVTVKTSESVFVGKQYVTDPQGFEDSAADLKTEFGLEVQPMPPTWEPIAKEIERTTGFKDIVSGPTTGVPIAIVSASRFNLQWATKFERAHSIEKKFHNLNGTTTSGRFMVHERKEHVYLEKEYGTVLQMPHGNRYDKPTYASYFVLPPANTGREGLDKIVREFSLDEVVKECDRTEPQRADLFIPCCTIRTPRRLQDLKRTLLPLGLRRPVGYGLQDHLGSFIHQVEVELDETGCRLAVATVLSTSRGLAPPTKKILIDRPFYYVVRATWPNGEPYPIVVAMVTNPDIDPDVSTVMPLSRPVPRPSIPTLVHGFFQNEQMRHHTRLDDLDTFRNGPWNMLGNEEKRIFDGFHLIETELDVLKHQTQFDVGPDDGFGENAILFFMVAIKSLDEMRHTLDLIRKHLATLKKTHPQCLYAAITMLPRLHLSNVFVCRVLLLIDVTVLLPRQNILFTEIKKEVKTWDADVWRAFAERELQLMISVSCDEPHPFLTYWGEKLAATTVSGSSVRRMRIVHDLEKYRRTKEKDVDTHVIVSPPKQAAVSLGSMEKELFPSKAMEVRCSNDRSGNQFAC